ncbi:MAG: GTP cyclohydrolase I FolE [Pseudomonadales bacterium]
MLSDDAIAVRKRLQTLGLETPLQDNGLDNEQKYELIKGQMSEVMRTLGLDLGDDSLHETPHRVAKMYVYEIFSGLDYENFPKIATIENKMGVEEMVKVRGIGLLSSCEHHFVTIDGTAKVAYIPKSKIIGLSKINRLVQFFGRRPQVQERLTQQILVSLQTLLETDDVAVSVSATHYCVKSRGVMDTNSETDTTALGGVFKTNARTRAEFLT